MDPVDDETNRFVADPQIQGSLDAYLERERRGALSPGLFARLAVPKEWRVKDGGGG